MGEQQPGQFLESPDLNLDFKTSQTSNSSQDQTFLSISGGNLFKIFRNKKRFIISGLASLLVLLMLLVGFVSVFKARGKKISFLSKLQSFQVSKPETKQWINCADIRDVIEDENRLYIACLGGILVVDPNSGQVINQISMTNGLGNNVTTSLVKRGDILYIGTQDGFTKFNLLTKEAQKISLEEGLINNKNIILAEDGEYLWVGTFDGLGRYHIPTGVMANFREELTDNSTAYNISKILVTPNAVYASIIASAQSPGGIARWDKKDGKWEKFGISSFLEKIDEYYSRVDFIELARAGNKIFAINYTEKFMLYESEDKPSTRWRKLGWIVDKIKTEAGDMGSIRLIGGEKELRLLVNGRLYSYNPANEEVRLVYSPFTDGNNPLQEGFITARNNKMWISGARWLRWLELSDFQGGSISLAQRPKDFNKLLGIIDRVPILQAEGTIWKFDLTKEEFNKISSMSEFGSEFGFGGGDYGRLLFQPLPQTQKVFLFSQICGMVCDQPKFAIFDYKKESLRPIEIPQEIKQRLIGSNKEQIFDFDSLSDEEFDFPRSEFKFRIGTTKDAAILNTNNLTWRLGNSVLGDKVFSSEPNQVFCNPSYQLEKNNGRFSELSCDQFLENSQYRWRYTTTDDKGLWQESKVTGERIKLAIPATRINKITYTQNRLWVGTDKGLAIFDPSTSEWKVLGVRDGLVSDEVFDFMVGEDVVWILTFWGGLSRVVF